MVTHSLLTGLHYCYTALPVVPTLATLFTIGFHGRLQGCSLRQMVAVQSLEHLPEQKRRIGFVVTYLRLHVGS